MVFALVPRNEPEVKNGLNSCVGKEQLSVLQILFSTFVCFVFESVWLSSASNLTAAFHMSTIFLFFRRFSVEW